MTDETELRRRRFLRSTGAVGMVALAGCSGGGGGGGGSGDGFKFRKLAEPHTLEDVRKAILNPKTQDNLRLEPTQQIRLGKGKMTLDGKQKTSDGKEEAKPQNPSIFTLRETRPVEVAKNEVAISGDSLKVIGASKGDSASFVDYAPNPDITTRDSAKANNEYIEQVISSDRNAEVCYVATHGGQVYPYTAQQANRVASSRGESAWTTLAFEEDEKTLLNRWYVPATEIHPASYPKLSELDDNYRYAVAFSGFETQPSRANSNNEGVAVGGLVDETTLNNIRDKIKTVLENNGAGNIPVWRYPTGAPQNPPAEHVVNWLTDTNRSGIEVTTTLPAREKHWHHIADGVEQGIAATLKQDDR